LRETKIQVSRRFTQITQHPAPSTKQTPTFYHL
jgi:hypothetical protein